jgi:uncharacterized membrane protein YebE (DUF533 family)
MIVTVNDIVEPLAVDVPDAAVVVVVFEVEDVADDVEGAVVDEDELEQPLNIKEIIRMILKAANKYFFISILLHF